MKKTERRAQVIPAGAVAVQSHNPDAPKPYEPGGADTIQRIRLDDSSFVWVVYPDNIHSRAKAQEGPFLDAAGEPYYTYAAPTRSGNWEPMRFDGWAISDLQAHREEKRSKWLSLPPALREMNQGRR